MYKPVISTSIVVLNFIRGLENLYYLKSKYKETTKATCNNQTLEESVINFVKSKRGAQALLRLKNRPSPPAPLLLLH